MTIADLSEQLQGQHPDDRVFAKYSKREILNCLATANSCPACNHTAEVHNALIAKRAHDGLNGRPWSAVKHFEAEQAVRNLLGEAPLS